MRAGDQDSTFVGTRPGLYSSDNVSNSPTESLIPLKYFTNADLEKFEIKKWTSDPSFRKGIKKQPEIAKAK